MTFLEGFICGVLFSILVIATLAFFRSAIERRIMVVERKLQNAGPQPRGYVIEPEDEAEVVRKEIIEENTRRGRDTHITELL